MPSFQDYESYTIPFKMRGFKKSYPILWAMRSILRFYLFLLFPKSVGDAAFCQVIRGQFDFDTIAWENFDVVPTNLARNVSENIEAIIQVNAKHSIG